MTPPPTPVAWGGGSVVIDLMFDVLPIGCGGPGFGSLLFNLDSGVHHYVLTTTESWQNFGQ